MYCSQKGQKPRPSHTLPIHSKPAVINAYSTMPNTVSSNARWGEKLKHIDWMQKETLGWSFDTCYVHDALRLSGDVPLIKISHGEGEACRQ
jgi:hypothetical protein